MKGLRNNFPMIPISPKSDNRAKSYDFAKWSVLPNKSPKSIGMVMP